MKQYKKNTNFSVLETQCSYHKNKIKLSNAKNAHKEQKRTLKTFHLFKAFQSPYICSLTKIYKITCALIKKMI